MIEAIVAPPNDSKMVIKFLKKHIFTQFSTPRVLLSNNGTHFCDKSLESLLKRHMVFHIVVTPITLNKWPSGGLQP